MDLNRTIVVLGLVAILTITAQTLEKQTIIGTNNFINQNLVNINFNKKSDQKEKRIADNIMKTTEAPNTHFSKSQDVYIINDNIHIAMDVDTRPFQNVCDEAYSLLQHIRNDEEYNEKWSNQVQIRIFNSNIDDICDNKNLFKEQNFNTNNRYGTMTIQKRALPLQIAKAAGAHGIIAIFTHYAMTTLTEIFNSIFTQKIDPIKVLEVTTDIYRTLREEIRYYANKLKETKKYFSDKADWKQNHYLTAITQTTTQVMKHLNFHRRLVQNVMDGNIPTDLFSSKNLEDLFNELTKRASQRLGFLLPKTPIEILQMPVSFFMTEDKLSLLIHIPIILDKAAIYSHIPLPTPQNNLALTDIRHDQILVTNKFHLHFPIPKARINDFCFTFRQKLLCHKIGILHKAPETCIAALYYANTQMASKFCHKTEITEEGYVAQITHNQFLISVAENTTLPAKLIFGNGTSLLTILKGRKIITLPKDTTLHTEKFLLTPTEQTNTQESVMHDLPSTSAKTMDYEKEIIETLVRKLSNNFKFDFNQTKLENIFQNKAEMTQNNLKEKPIFQQFTEFQKIILILLLTLAVCTIPCSIIICCKCVVVTKQNIQKNEDGAENIQLLDNAKNEENVQQN